MTTSAPARLAVLLLLVLGLPLLIATRAGAQDGWSFVVTPQVWLAHIEKNGFASAAGLGPGGIGCTSSTCFNNQFVGENSKSADEFNPQWGIQFAAQKDRWTLAASFQYVTFTTQSDLIFNSANGGSIGNPGGVLSPGQRAAQEFVDTTRIDIDLIVSYLFPDVIKDRLDLSLGGGVKAIHASATREFGRLSPFAANTATVFALGKPGLYTICTQDSPLGGCSTTDRVKTTDWIYGLTIPLNATWHLTNRWLLPVSITPFIGAETRDDKNVVYQSAPNTFPNTAAGFRSLQATRLDGTTFAVGVTTDVTVRYLLSDSVSVYAGGRVQFIDGHEKYLAYGPIVGMSARFGGK